MRTSSGLCGWAAFRAAGYRHFGPHAPAREDADLRDLIQRAVLTNRHYGDGALLESCAGRA